MEFLVNQRITITIIVANKELKIINSHLKKHDLNKHQQSLTIEEENNLPNSKKPVTI
jgi:hypothetical protein